MNNKIRIILIIIFILILTASGVIIASTLEEVKVKGNTYYTKEKLKNELQKYCVGGNTILSYLRIKYDKNITIPFVDELMVGSIVDKRKGLPVVTGISYEAAVFNKPISARNKEVFELTLNITQLIKKYGLNIDKIEFEKNLSIKLYDENVKIMLGKRKHFDEQISNLAEILPKTKGLKGTLHMEDFSEIKKRVIFEADK